MCSRAQCSLVKLGDLYKDCLTSREITLDLNMHLRIRQLKLDFTRVGCNFLLSEDFKYAENGMLYWFSPYPSQAVIQTGRSPKISRSLKETCKITYTQIRHKMEGRTTVCCRCDLREIVQLTEKKNSGNFHPRNSRLNSSTIRAAEPTKLQSNKLSLKLYINMQLIRPGMLINN